MAISCDITNMSRKNQTAVVNWKTSTIYENGIRYVRSGTCVAGALVIVGYAVMLMDRVTSMRENSLSLCVVAVDAIRWSFSQVKLAMQGISALTLSPPIPLTPSTPAVPNCCCSKGSAPYWSNPPFLMFDIRGALWRSVPSVRAPECQTLKMVG